MLLQGSTTIDAPREQVWQCLTDAGRVSRCAPGIESYEVIEPARLFRITARIGFGTLQLKFLSDVEWLEIHTPSHGTLQAQGTASGNTADVATEMTLIELDSNQTQLTWGANIILSGTLATSAPQMIGSAAHKMAAAFFDCVKGEVGK